MYAAAADKDMPRRFAKLNSEGVPENAVFWSSVMVTVILFAVQFVDNALDFTLDLTAVLALAPFALASAYAVKIAWQRDGYAKTSARQRKRELTIAILSTGYTLFLLWAAGYTFFFLSCILLAPATILYVLARREQKAKLFTTPGLILFLTVLAFAVIGIVLLAKGVVQI
jgi:arginine:ornithine antiporter/lysine permease